VKAVDVMTSRVVSVGPDASVREATGVLLTHRISAVPGTSKRRELLRIVSEGDLMRTAEEAVKPRRSWWLKLLAGTDTLNSEQIKSAKAGHVVDVMSREERKKCTRAY